MKRGHLRLQCAISAGPADEVGSVRMRRYFESEAKEEPGIDSSSQLVDGQRAARRERLRLERESFLLATLAHAVVLAAVISRMGVAQFAPTENESVEVEIVAKLEVPAAHSPRPADEPAVQPSVSEPRKQTTLMPRPAAPSVNPLTKPIMIKATQMLSETMLSDPRSQGVTQALAQMNVEDRAAQICSIEAMGQIAKNDSRFYPELVSSYAMSQLKFKGRVVTAEGAAFQSSGIWYNLAFRCQISPDRARVQSFEFAIGDTIPQSKWSSLNLTSSHGWHSHD